MKKQVKIRMLDFKHMKPWEKRICQKKLISCKNKFTHSAQLVRRTNVIAGWSMQNNITTSNLSTKKVVVEIRNSGTNIPGRDSFPPLPDGVKPPKQAGSQGTGENGSRKNTPSHIAPSKINPQIKRKQNGS